MRSEARRFRVTHAFHPLRGRDFAVVMVRHNWGEDRVYYHDEQDRLFSIPAAWTDVVAADPVVTIGAGRAPFRLQDLLELARLVHALEKERHNES